MPGGFGYSEGPKSNFFVENVMPRNKHYFAVALSFLMTSETVFPMDKSGTMEIRIHIGSRTVQPTLHTDQNVLSSIEELTVTEQRRLPSPFPRQRNPELSKEQLVIIALDSQGHEVVRVLCPDPRIIRAEVPDAAGKLVSRFIYRSAADFSVVIPDNPRISQLQIYHPNWMGSEFVLEPIGNVPFP
jgi:hypothetical protein